MSIYFDKRKQKYVVRIQISGVRYYLGSYQYEREAEHAERKYMDRWKRTQSFTLDNYKPRFEVHEEKYPWLKRNIVDRCVKFYRDRKEDRETRKKIEKL